MFYKILIAIVFLLGSLVTTTIALARINSRYMTWSGMNIDGALKKDSKWNYDVMNQARTTDNRSTLEQYFFRPSIYYQFDENWSAWLGYDLIPTIPRTQVTVIIEQRIWPQLEYDNEVSKHLGISLRSRFEYRWLSGGNESIATRFRQRVEFSIINWNRYDIDLDFFDELFIGVNKAEWVTDRTIDQNRIFAGVVIPISKTLAFETGYLNILRPRKPNSRMDHIWLVALSFNFDDHKPIPIRTV